MHRDRFGRTGLLIMTMAISGTIAASGDVSEILGGECGGEDPRTRAICECLSDQITDRLSGSELEQLADFQRQSQSDEEPAKTPDSQDMERLMAITRKLQGIDTNKCLNAQPR